VSGTWTASFADTRQEEAGRLLGWELRLDGVTATPPPETVADPVAIPEPQTTQRIGSALGPAGRRALSWPADPAVRGDLLVWDVARGTVIGRIPRPAELQTARFVLGHSAVLISGARELELRQTSAGKVIGRLRLTPGADPLVSANGRFLVAPTVTKEGANALTVYDLNGLRPIGQLVTGVQAEVLAVDPLGRYLAVGDGERFVRIWTLRDMALAAECEHTAPPRAIQFDSQGRWLATQDATYRLQFWNIESGCTPAFSRPGSGAWLVAFAPDSALVAAGSYGRGFSVLALPGGERLGSTLQPGMGGAGAAPTSHAARPQPIPALGVMLTYDGRSALKLWQLPQSGNISASAIREDATEALAVSPDGQLAALGTRTGDVRIMPLGASGGASADGDPGFIGHLSGVTRLAFDPEGKLVASGSREGTLRVWDSASGAPRNFFGAHLGEPLHDLVFLPETGHVAAASRSAVLVIDASTGTTAARTSIQAEDPRLAGSADGESIFVAGDRDGLTRWDWRADRLVSLGDPQLRIRRLARSPQGQFLATAGADRIVRIWWLEASSALRRTFTAPSPVDRLWFLDEQHLLVQAGAWLHTLEVESTGLEPTSSRLLPDGGTLLSPLAGSGELLLVRRAFSAQPEPLRVPLSGSWAAPLPEPLPRLTESLTARLQLRIDELGETQPLESNPP
jgi:WD40 repeat protein